MSPEEKVHENRLRRVAARRGLKLIRSRRRDPRAADFGGYKIIDEAGGLAYGYGWNNFGASIGDIEKWLNA